MKQVKPGRQSSRWHWAPQVERNRTWEAATSSLRHSRQLEASGIQRRPTEGAARQQAATTQVSPAKMLLGKAQVRRRRSSQGGVRASEKRRGPGDALHPRKFNKNYGARLPLFLSRFPVAVNPPNKKSVSLWHVGVWRPILKDPFPRCWECHSNGPGRVFKLACVGSSETRPHPVPQFRLQ